MECPYCSHQWENKVENPKACPRCKHRLDKTASMPVRMSIEAKKEKCVCDVCGENMHDPARGNAVMALFIDLVDDQKPKHKEYAKLKEAFGKTTFKICYKCWVKSLGVKENVV